MIKLLIYLVLFSISTQLKASCVTDKEYEVISKSLEGSNDEYYDKYPYGRIENIASCKEKSVLSDLVCDNPRLKKMLLLLSISEIYAYENATHTPVEDYSTYNDDFKEQLNYILEQEKDKNIAMRKLCHITKTRLSDNLGGDFYYKPEVHEVISSKLNSNGVIIMPWLLPEIYLGKSCDALDSTKRKGKWYKTDEQFIVELNGEIYKFNHDNNVFKLNCEPPK
ncbi:hypothetical protein EDC44_1312 [Cricetibacter osteomyelitidis]|uniref:Uncharacterized protein n=1 Tax=Cricetibacter osteomyelitidis TaxID=1521931 RepID=A0A4R2SSF9_9PAST|nr:hypothetical protein [Cricetibacter osteomyelitidis]TCP91296.1 hypothetical protein EDC44_1312 [Cricetibacter osteomyelitidis]